MRSLKNKVIRLEQKAGMHSEQTLGDQFAALELGKYGYSGQMALVVACMEQGLDEATERLPELLKYHIRETLAENTV